MGKFFILVFLWVTYKALGASSRSHFLTSILLKPADNPSL